MHWKRIEPCLGDGMKLAVIGDDLLTPQQAHYLDLFLDEAATRLEVHAECFILHRIPADPHAQT